MTCLRYPDIGRTPLIMHDEGHFSVRLHLRLLLRFCKDFKIIIGNTRQVLILTSSNTDIKDIMNSNDHQVAQKLKYLQRLIKSIRAFITSLKICSKPRISFK